MWANHKGTTKIIMKNQERTWNSIQGNYEVKQKPHETNRKEMAK